MKESLIFKRSSKNPDRWDFQYSIWSEAREHGPHILTGPYLVILADELFKPFKKGEKHE